MPNSSHSSDRLQFPGIVVAAVAMVAVIFGGHVMTSPSEHVLGPDLVFAAVLGIPGFGALVLWGKHRRRQP